MHTQQTRQHIHQRLLAEKLVLIIRLPDHSQVYPVVEVIHQCAVGAVEVTSNTPGYLTAIQTLRKTYSDLLVGAGTVTNVEIAQQAINAGAQFLVTPNISEAVVKLAHQNDIPVVMGAFTPSEVVLAQQYGADIIKLFPAGDLGLSYFKSLAKGPFLDTQFFPVGGISSDNAAEWIKAGAAGVGVGGSLIKPINTADEALALKQMLNQLLLNIQSGIDS